MLLWRGGRKLSADASSPQLPPAPLEQGGGFGNAIVGTLMIVALAVLVSVPIGLLTAIYLAQAQGSRGSAGVVRFCAKVLTGFPSILAGVFAYGAVVLVTGGYSAVAGAVALSILMLPTIILTVGGCHPHGAGADEGRGDRHGRDPDADRLDGAAADRDAGHPDRRHAGGGARRRRDGAAAVHRAVQQLLAVVERPRRPDAADRVAGGAHLQLRRACRSRTRSSWPGRRRWCWC